MYYPKMKITGGHLLAKIWKHYCLRSKIHQSTNIFAIRTCSRNTEDTFGFSKKDIREFNFATHILKPWVNKAPNRCALWISDGSKSTKVSYNDLMQKSQYLANALYNIGSPKCAIVVLPKISPWWVINIAGSFIGMIISPGTTMLTEREIIYRLECCNADTIFCSSDLMNKYDKVTKHLPYRIVCDEHREDTPLVLRNGWKSYHDLVTEGKKLPEVEPIKDGDAIAQLFFTSGTTGKPKMVPHTQSGYGMGQHEGSRDIFCMDPSDVFWNMSDLGWAKAAYSSLYIPLIAGCTMFLHQMTRFDPKVVIKTLREEPITVLCSPPTALRSIIQEDISSFRSSKLKRIYSAGEPVNPEIIEAFIANNGIPIYEVYGQTETTALAATKPGDVQKLGSMGKQASTYNIVIVDDDLNELETGEIGQIAINTKKSWPYGLCKEYFKSEDQTRKSFVNGLYLTGDKALRDKDGYLWYVGRADDIIISAGYRIGPFEVESALLEHPAIGESAVVASPDSLRGHVVKAFIVLTDEFATKTNCENDIDALKKDIQKFIKSTIAPYKYPRKIEFVKNLPKTVSGKIRRIELREKEIIK